MKTITVIIVSFWLMLSYCAILIAGSDQATDPTEIAIHQIANIIFNLNHYPDSTEKEQLKNIKENKALSSSLHTLADSVLNIKHYPSQSDKEKLQALINDHSVPEELRKLARIVSNISHRPTAADKKDLRNILK